MQTEAEAFLQRIRAYPDDDAQRLIFADWLDEEGDPRGRFIRVQLALAHLPEGDRARPALLAEERQLLAAHRDTWEAPLRGLISGPVFRRGFVDEVKVEAKQFLQHAHRIFDATPVRRVHLLDVGGNLPAVMQCPYLSRLSALTVYAQHASEPLARAVARSPHLGALRVLHLGRNRLADDAVEHLAGSPNLPALEELDLSENEIGETGALALAGSPHLGNLRRLELRENRLGPGGAEALAGSDRLTSLRTLGLGENEIGTPRLLSLARPHALLTVPVLDLTMNELTHTGLQAILGRRAADHTAIRLEELHLGSNTLNDAGAVVLAHSPHLAGLTALTLTSCGIGDEGVRALANSPHLERVDLLDLSNNPIGETGFRALLNSPYWRGLRRLVYSPLNLTHEMRKALDQKYNRPPRRV
ncbi:Leucine Rich repeats (2 copies) [Gemmata obscuriglobus]|uniref:TIGR02996 domain-containing protein n=1 Tax=Gemmata obscuriglobus TaxID=114 RepID=A0A2Z3HEN5_9BACT|nr:TIGR02996 domain-containing protein [Gemmata obscuriglobus]AWM39750.1 TIGR02996 domain-containing protein [Gemmata obscuriglobus]QEG27134.1 Leucine Rich repeats (2 copies) [Gemmata obscuriglobus]VTS03700.1 Leucine-rich repeat-containing protein typical subtype OS=Herpetosiphon aurantiacus (strain ATCC 23779 / DSM 785) GN=Haur_4051 PE=4 SV=1: LRR_6: LRR_6: LRR_6: LRR_6 [Gemmata obscuriglobus UQM 2246]